MHRNALGEAVLGGVMGQPARFAVTVDRPTYRLGDSARVFSAGDDGDGDDSE